MIKYAGPSESILPAYTVENVGGVKVGFIGMTLEGTPNIVTAAGIAGLSFTDEVRTANGLVPALQGAGVEAIVVLLHQGGSRPADLVRAGQQALHGHPSYDGCARRSPARLADHPSPGLDPEIDMVVSGHTHQPYICDIQDPAGQQRLVTIASSFGRLFTDTNLVLDTRTDDIVRAVGRGRRTCS